MRLALASLALLTLAACGTPSEPVTPHADVPAYSLHGFDLSGDGSAVTLSTGHSLPDCENIAAIASEREPSYLFTCRADG